MGITRQSVQRIADLLVERGLAEYFDNPAHRRAKLVRITESGLSAVHQINPAHKAMAVRLVEAMGAAELDAALTSMLALSAAVERIESE
jgi:DNA-binding MarR family transcriptional regulator